MPCVTGEEHGRWLPRLLWSKFQRLTALLHAEVSDHWFLVAAVTESKSGI